MHKKKQQQGHLMKIQAYNFLSKFISTPFTFLALFITEFGDLYILTSITLLIIFFSRNKHAKILVPLNFITIIFFNQLIKYIVQRPRPDIFQLTHASGFSFPSGHSMTSIAFYGYLLYLLFKNEKNKNKRIIYSSLLIILVLLIGLSRIYLGVHYLSDVIAGFLLAFIYLVFFIKISEKYYVKGGNKMKKGSLLDSFKYAFIGIFSSIREERNLFIHVSIMTLVIISGFIFKINLYEWFTCIILFIIVISAELFNTAIETTVNLACKEIHPLAKKAKDISAGAVLITAIGASIIGLIIFIPKVISYLS